MQDVRLERKSNVILIIIAKKKVFWGERFAVLGPFIALHAV